MFRNNGVYLTPKFGFLAKNQRPGFIPEPIFLPDMTVHSAVKDDRLWCPVRALKFYLAATKELRGEVKQLFVQMVKPHEGIRTATLSSWIVKTIKCSYPPELCPGNEGDIRAHDVRGVSATWALFHNVSLSEVLSAAAWKSANTFISCYMKDTMSAECRFGARVITAGVRSARSQDLLYTSMLSGRMIAKFIFHFLIMT